VAEAIFVSRDFVSNWEDKREPSTTEKIKEAIKPAGPLKPRLESAVRSLQMQIQRLDQIHARLSDRQKVMFEKVVDAVKKHDQARASIYANEVAEIRKMVKLIMQSRLALESIAIRLGTVEDLGDIVVNLAPAIKVISTVSRSIGSVVPEAEKGMGEISQMLSTILVEAGQTGNYTISFETGNEDAAKIMEEAAAVAEARLKQEFPDLPLSGSQAQKQ
jgi:division protein CdvB (Snf7/Vps24/ESCRT-III family)